jgi:L-lactate utilization protein LutB
MNPMLEKNKAIWEETNKKLGESVVKALVSKGYKAYYFPSSKEAAQKILEMIPSGSTVGVPGTCTVREMGLMELLAEKGYLRKKEKRNYRKSS